MQHIYPISEQKQHLWIELLITLFGLAGIIFFITQYDRALPSASVNVSINRQQAEKITTQYLHTFGYSPEDYKYTLSFSGGGLPNIYLQRTLGVETFNARLSNESWPLYYWAARWFKPLEKEEFFVYLSPGGEFLGFEHKIGEDTPGTNVTQNQAQAISETFLNKYAKWNASVWQIVEASSETLPGGRIDHRFTWKMKGFSAGESELLYAVTIQGDKVGYAFTWIKTPETFSRKFATERNLAGFINDTAYFLGLIFFLLLGSVAVVISRPGPQFVIWPAIMAFCVTLASYLNYIPLYPQNYATTQDYTLFWINIIIGILFSALFSILPIIIGWLGGQTISKMVWSFRDRILERSQSRWINFSQSAWRGIRLGGAHLGYVVLFYIVTTHFFGWWNPVTTEYSDTFATPFPFFEAFEAGLIAALTEELIFRLIGISIFLWIFRNKHTWLAVLIPGALWAFAHTGYLTYPIYTRGIELTIVAIIYGYIFLKFDLMTTIMAHFTYNMMITGIILLRSTEPYYQFSGWIVVVVVFLPLVPGLFVTLVRSRSKSVAVPEHLILRPATEMDISALNALPVKAEWSALLEESGRRILCLTTGEALVGFITGTIKTIDNAIVDGIYVTPGWQRQYWGAKMLDALRRDFQNDGVEKIQAALYLNEKKAIDFLRNLHWHSSAQVLAYQKSPVFNEMVKKAWQKIYQTLTKKKSDDGDIEIPHKVL